MLKIYDVMLEVVREMRPILEAIATRDPNLADQMRRALQSVVLNTAEGMGSRGRNRQVRTPCTSPVLPRMTTAAHARAHDVDRSEVGGART